MEKSYSHRHRLLIAGSAVFLAALVGLLVYFAARVADDSLPEMPQAAVANEEVKEATDRLLSRAASYQSDEYGQSVIEAFYTLNREEAKAPGKNSDRIVELMNAFQTAGAIGSTGQKERFLIVGDYLAVKFDAALSTVLSRASDVGMKNVLVGNDPAMKEFVQLGGSFLRRFIETGVVGENGRLSVHPAVPQILFRKRWRILGGLPYRQDFLSVESRLDLNFALKHTPAANVDMRLASIKRLQGLDASFDGQLARALVLIEAERFDEAENLLGHLRKSGRADETLQQLEKGVAARKVRK